MQQPAQYQQQGGGWQPQQQPPQQQPPQQGGGWQPQQPPPGGGWGGQQQPPGGGGYGYEGPPLPPERNWMLIGGLIAGGVSCLFVVVVAIIILLLASDGNGDDEDNGPIGQPTVTILSPSQGQVFNVGDRITVQAQITDPGAGITRVQLLVNNVQFDNQVSQNPNGDQNMSVLLDYENTTIPSESLPLIVRAFRAGDAQGYDAAVTVSVRASTPTTATPQPGSTSAPVATQPPAATQAPFNPTCRARVDVEGLRFRRGPSTEYEIISSLRAGLEVPLVGRLGDNSWWEVTSGGQRGWVSAQFTTLLGSNTNCANIPISTPPASPTPIPSPTTAAQALPNLVISTLSGANNIVFTGGQVSATYILRVRNAGNAPAGAFNITITYPDGRVSDFTVASLAPNQEIDVPNVTATYTAIGTYRLSVLVDSSGNITESSKNDNTGFLDIIVSEPTPTPEGQ